MDARFELVYRESLRAIETQQAALESARSRAGQLLAAASVVTSVLGGLVHSKSRHPHVATWFALASFALLMILCIWVFLPRDWRFVNSATVMIDDWIYGAGTSIDTMHSELALRMEEHWDKNQDPLNKMMKVLQVSATLLVVSIVSWLIDLPGVMTMAQQPNQQPPQQPPPGTRPQLPDPMKPEKREGPRPTERGPGGHNPGGRPNGGHQR